MKTSSDVSTDEWIGLAEAAVDLLSCARFMFWLSGSGAGDNEDTSNADTLDKMAAALAVVGLPQGSTEEFEANLEALLKSGLTPEQWASRQDRLRLNL